jgi:MFS family permease
MLIGGLINLPIIWLMGRAANIWQLAALTAGCYFLASMSATLIYILAGLFVESGERGKIFGLLAFTSPLMMLVSSTIMGPIVDRWGFRTLFSIFAVYAILFLLPILFLEDKKVEQTSAVPVPASVKKPGLGKCFYLLILACIISSSAYFASRLGTSLAMNQLGFTMTAISITGAIGGAVALPLLPIIGWCSDRVGRKRLLTLCYLSGVIGLFILAISVFGWQFWISAGLMSITLNGVTAVGSAMVTDIVPRAALGRGMSLFNATTWIGGIIGLGSTGHAVQGFGILPTFVVVAILPLIAILLLIPIRPAETTAPAPAGN